MIVIVHPFPSFLVVIFPRCSSRAYARRARERRDARVTCRVVGSLLSGAAAVVALRPNKPENWGENSNFRHWSGLLRA
eukprot:270526-Prorocentrum_minimum.AAC.1